MGTILNFEQSQKVYKLEGESLQAAMQVYVLTGNHLAQKPVAIEGRNMKDIGDDYNQRFADAAHAIKMRKPELLEKIGLDAPATRVVDTYGLFQRAYHVFPSIHISEIDSSVYMYVPVDYKGHHFVPKDGILLDAEEAKKAGEKLFMGGWGSPAPVLPRPENSASMPADFDVNTSTMLANDPLLHSHGERHHRFFMVRKNGQSEQILNEFKDSKGHESRSFHALVDHIRAEFNAIASSNTVENADPSKTYSPGFMMGRDQSNGQPKLEITIQHDGIDFSENKARFAEKGDYFDTKYENNRPIMVPHERTPQAAKIKDLFDKISRQPSLYDYERILYPEVIIPSDKIDAYFGDRRAPIIREMGEDTVLEYRVNKGKKLNFCPPDAVELSKPLYLWLHENEEDAKRGYATPEMPKDLQKEYKLLKSLTMKRSVAPRPPFPKK